ncbi:class I SAM-dependent methyltransferase [Microlunatus ginsengisoli]|uniref:Methyltransferase domain-containing protein n=1 Tax=Microlunatus ginsengisoli TaxID=363863 RepID=A0ABP7AHE8_9ACTN
MYRVEVQQQTHFDNDSTDAPEQLRLLSEILGGHSAAVLSGLGIGAGARCWDIGSGDGSVARWLADQVGPTGSVLATDLKPEHVPVHPQIEARRHDLLADSWPAGRFDLIHARLVLMHLPRAADLALRLVEQLAPGGVLVLTDWFCDCAVGPVASPVDAYTSSIWWRYHDAVHDLGALAGMDLGWAAQTADVLRAAGHDDVTVLHDQACGRGGTPSALLARLHSTMLEDHLIRAGLEPGDLAAIRANLLDPGFEMATYHTFTTVLRAPQQAS